MAETLPQDARPGVSSQTLDAVAREIAVTLSDARVAIEGFVEQPDNVAFLERCEEQLRQVQGALRVLEIHGAALLAEEMCQVTAYLRAKAGEQKSQAEALEALMRAMVQLPSYLERVIAGGRDLALVLLPLLNDLRAVRGSPLLSEGTLLLLNLKSDRKAQPAPPAAGEEQISVTQWARRLRARYQVGLIGWIKGERVDQNLEILASVANRLEQVATCQPVFQLWWVIGAVIEALRSRGLEGGVSVKRLLGLGDREIRRLYEEGEQRYAQSPPVELLNNLLYYVARATSAGPRITAVRQSFRLGELLPVDESVEQERENLSAPSVKLMHTVAAAIREDLAKIKDVLDIFLRRGGASPEELVPQVDLLRKIGDTLGVLGLGEQRARVQGEIARLEQLISSQERPADGVLVDIATTLIRIEDHLDEELVSMILPHREDDAGAAVDIDFQQVQAAVLRECIVNLSRIKEYVGQCVGGTLDTAGFDNWPELMRGIQAGLLMLGKSRAVVVSERMTVQLRALLRPGAQLASESLERLADAIVSLEYYMETLQAGRADPWYMLDNAESALAVVESGPKPAVAIGPAGGVAHEPTRLIPVPTAPSTQAESIASKRQLPALETTDPELVELYIDEAREEVARIEHHFSVWDQNPLEEESLFTVRRSFHTLKGSGRVVGARDISEFAWAIESLLNRLLDKSVSRSPQILATLRDAVRVLPQLVAQLADGVAPAADVPLLAGRAHALAIGRTIEEAVPISPTMPVRVLAPSTREPALPDALVPATVAPVPSPSQPGLAAELPAAEVAGETMVFARPDFVSPVQPEVAVAAAEGYRALTSDLHDAFAAEAAQPVEPPPSEPVLADADVTLRDIYAREIDSHVAVVRDFLRRGAGQAAFQPLPEPVYRACHTLAGSSKMAGARHGIRLAQPLDHWLRKAFDTGFGLGQSDLALLGDCMTAMEAVSRHLDESTGFFLAHDRLRERIADAEAQLDQRIAQQSHGEPPSLLAVSPESPPGALDGVGEIKVLPEAMPPEQPGAGEMPLTAVEQVPAEEIADAAFEYDPEIAAIFSEEATELLETAQVALSGATRDSAPSDAIIALKRPLHTLKGGARMAGITTMGDLAHELESLITRIEIGVAPWGPHTYDALQASLDELARMRDLIAAGRPVGAARALVARVQALGMAPGMPVFSASGAPPEVSGSAARQDAAAPVPPHEVPEPVSAPAEEESAPQREISAGAESPAGVQIETLPEISPHVGAFEASEFVAPESVSETVGMGERPKAPDAGRPAPIQVLPIIYPSFDNGAVWPADGVVPRVPELGEAVAALEAPPGEFAAYEPQPEVAEPAAPVAEPVESAVPGPGSGAILLESPEVVSPGPPAPEAEQLPTLAAAVVPPGREPMQVSERVELARVDPELLNQLLNNAGEVSIGRARVEQQLGSVEFNLGELSRTVTRLKEQLRKLEIETEAQILHRHEAETAHRGDFDPLELDRYSSIQQFSRALAETANDVASIQQLLETLTGDAQTLLQQQGRMITELQNGLMRTRMVSFQRHVQRLSRIVRQAAADTNKQVELVIEGASGEFDRQVLERMLPPLEHLLRNAVVHGIESPVVRRAAGKPETGRITLSLRREGAEFIIVTSDDGAGMNLPAIREKGIALGLIKAGQPLSDEAVMQLVLEPGFSTASAVTQAAGRGIGMDVVATEIKKLGGSLNMQTEAGKGSRFTIRLPFTLAVSHALVVRIGEEIYALPLPTVEGVVRLPAREVAAHLGEDAPPYVKDGYRYRLQHLGVFVGLEPSALPEHDVTLPVVLVRAGEHSTGLIADDLIGSREIVVKAVGPQVGSIRGISGATILGDGRIAIILDIGALVRSEWRGRPPQHVERDRVERRVLALVVDDSITVRRVTQRLLERHGMKVLTARDGTDALAVLQENTPDIILLDIEMPRMDGYEVAAQVRADPRTRDIPIIMITSRVGEKHRARAIELGVDDYLGKPYQESQLLDAIEPLVAQRFERLGLPPPQGIG